MKFFWRKNTHHECCPRCQSCLVSAALRGEIVWVCAQCALDEVLRLTLRAIDPPSALPSVDDNKNSVGNYNARRWSHQNPRPAGYRIVSSVRHRPHAGRESVNHEKE